MSTSETKLPAAFSPAAAIVAGDYPELPAGPEAKLQAIDLCLQAGRRLTHWLAVLVAQARQDYATPEEWVAAMRERFGWEKSHIHHLRAEGDLLWNTRGGVFHGTLCRLDHHKLLAISRIPRGDLKRFFSRCHPNRMDRDAVRQAVGEFLGEGGKKKAGGTPAVRAHRQLDFEDLLFGLVEHPISDEQHAELVASDRVKPLNAAISGLDLVRVAAEKWAVAQMIDETELEETIDELDSLRATLIKRLTGAGSLVLEA